MINFSILRKSGFALHLKFAVRLLCAVCLMSSCTLQSGCQHYQVGNHGLYRQDIRTIYVPMFEADTYRRLLAERVYEAVIKEIDLKTPFKVVTTPAADSVLTVSLVSEAKRLLVRSPTDEGREIEVSLFARATWTDRRGTILNESEALPVLPAIAEIGQTASFVPEVGQSLSTAQQKAIDRLAERIVAMMEKPW